MDHIADVVNDEILNETTSVDKESGKDVQKLKRFACKQPGCVNSFNQSRLLKRHMRLVHQMNNLHRCGLCDKRCKSSAALERHLSRHNKILSDFACDDCQQNVLSLEDLRKHCEVVHGNA